MKYNIVSLVMKHSISTTHKNLRCRECMHSQPVLNRDSQQYGILKTLWLLINPAMVLPFHCNSPFQTCHILAMFGNKFGSQTGLTYSPVFTAKVVICVKQLTFPPGPFVKCLLYWDVMVCCWAVTFDPLGKSEPVNVLQCCSFKEMPHIHLQFNKNRVNNLFV